MMKAKTIDVIFTKVFIILSICAVISFLGAESLSFGQAAICIILLFILNELADICRVISYKG